MRNLNIDLVSCAKWIVFIRAWCRIEGVANIYSSVCNQQSFRINKTKTTIPVPFYISNILCDVLLDQSNALTDLTFEFATIHQNRLNELARVEFYSKPYSGLNPRAADFQQPSCSPPDLVIKRPASEFIKPNNVVLGADLIKICLNTLGLLRGQGYVELSKLIADQYQTAWLCSDIRTDSLSYNEIKWVDEYISKKCTVPMLFEHSTLYDEIL